MLGTAHSNGSWRGELAVKLRRDEEVFPGSQKQLDTAPKLEPGPPPPTHPCAG